MVSNMDAFVGFMGEYASFFEGAAQEEKSKLEALVSGRIKEIEQSISRQQAVHMKMENMEKTREELQESVGFPTQTLRQIIDGCAGEERLALENVLKRLSEAVETVRYYNEKSMALVRDNLEMLREASAKAHPVARQYSPQTAAQSGKTIRSGLPLFETKI